MSSNLTLAETAESLHGALRDYIEATYHISDQNLVDQRRQLLERPGVISQVPYIESTPRYMAGPKFEELGLPKAALEVLLKASAVDRAGSPLVHNPPYQHQADALRRVLVDGRSIVVTTGTGSGKTECFLLPILGRLAMQASSYGRDSAQAAIRALVLYPMNALVNDQLGRLRLLLGDPEIADWFAARSGRPARFARYTSRTLYPGVRSAKRDQLRLRPLRKYYVEVARSAADASGIGAESSRKLLAELKSRGKWPAKHDLVAWFGPDNSRWQDRAGNYLRCVTLPADPELLTRHEVLENPPDLLVTNYSMLEYMLMRPLERQLFDRTRDWLANNPDETFLVVVDEAHLYRGAAGAEVGLLLRRLRDRIGITADRLQVICTTASFADADQAPAFGAALTGKEPSDFISISGSLALKDGSGPGSPSDAAVLAAVDLEAFYGAPDDDRSRHVQSVLAMRGVVDEDARTGLFTALAGYGPMKLLVNETMQRARPVVEIASTLFAGADPLTAGRAATALVSLGSFAREPGALDGPGLIPSRLHVFFRGLPGLWVCVDPQCSMIPSEQRGGLAGRLYEQPMMRCECGARIFELYTCRHCGTAYCRAYTDNLESPSFLWGLQGEGFSSASGQVGQMDPIDILLGQPTASSGLRPADLDLVTGRLDPMKLGDRNRTVYLPDNVDDKGVRSGEFKPCAVCGKAASYGRSSVQDHQTKGDEPFQALVVRQVEIQQPSESPTTFAPMAGRKVLVFSDSRQTAARLAPNLQKYTTRDAVRPLLVVGFNQLLEDPDIGQLVTLEESYLAVLLAMARLEVRLRPATRSGETFQEDVARIGDYLSASHTPTAIDKFQLLLDFRTRSQTAPEALTAAIHAVTNDQYTGLSALAIGTIEPRDWTFINELSSLSADIDTEPQKKAVVRTWLDAWHGSWLQAMPTVWAEDEITPKTGKFPTRMKNVLSGPDAQRAFERDWLPVVLGKLAQPAGRAFRLRGADLTIGFDGDWGYCQTCRSTQRPVPGRADLCTYCGQHAVTVVEPNTDPVFLARKGYYRRSTVLALQEGRSPIALVAAEHTAQLNEAQADAVFSEAEENELLFQDVDLGDGKPAIDVLSCTTTMEVGIDIGALAGVALRNMPPSRANYQQRSGRAGRRGRAIATVTAFASSQSHDEHGFGAPDEFIRGPVVDPEMSLDNWQIARRHLTAFVIQEYLRDRLPMAPGLDGAYGSQLFEVLGTVVAFRQTTSSLNQTDFRTWVSAVGPALAERASDWLPAELGHARELEPLTIEVIKTADIVDDAIRSPDATSGEATGESDEIEEVGSVELPPEVGEEGPGSASPPETLLGRLLYKGALPRYAFPTDVGTFHVFNAEESTPYRPVFRYTPSQGMAVALSQYAPGRRVWIGGKEWVSGALYSRMPDDRFTAWASRRLYMECGVCHYATTEPFDTTARGLSKDCPACGAAGELGPAQVWMRPPGFAHPYYWAENTSPDDDVPPSYATRAKLTTAAPADADAWARITDRIAVNFDRRRLLVTNRGPEDDGYSYCTRCGLIEPAASPRPLIVPGHRKPFPDQREPLCSGEATARSLVLGTEFHSDVLLIALRVDEPLTLRPEYESTRVAMRTLAEALTIQATTMLGISSSELQAEFRPALTAEGHRGTAAEIYMYDTLPGGAGFAQRVGNLGRALFEGALLLLEACPAGCDSSCYRCLQSYKNQFEHSLLDRHLGASLLRYLLTSEQPRVDTGRAESSTDLLYVDLVGLELEDLRLSRHAPVDVPGFGVLEAPIFAQREGRRGVVIALHHPCAPGLLLDEAWAGPAEFGVEPVVVKVDELAVRRNLPWASSAVLKDLGYTT